MAFGHGTTRAPRLRGLHASFPAPRSGRGLLVLGLVSLAVSTAGLQAGVQPFAGFYYLFAWYSVLLAAEGWLAWRTGSFRLLARPAHLVSVLLWSAVIWLFYELLNFRLQNWYYVFLPQDRIVRWPATVLSFATVLPAVFLSEALLAAFGAARDTRWRPLRITPGFLPKLQIAGVIMFALVMIWPGWFFPLVWGATTLFVEPLVYRKAPDRSILGDLEKGQPGRLLRLLLGGAAIGFVWELLNVGARAKWIYTVPGLEEFKLFEMPVLGFFGFPPFALECFVLWQALVVLGAAVPRSDRSAPQSPARRRVAVTLAGVFAAIVLWGMDARTVSSLDPRLTDLPGVPAERLQRAGFDVFRLARADATEVAMHAGTDPEVAEEWVKTAQLASLRGIGEHARALERIGITSVEQLARADADVLVQHLEAVTGRTWIAARVRVWIRGARAALAAQASP
jgi:hypothetical protein